MIQTQVTFNGDDMVQRRFQDVEPVLDECKRLRSLGATGSGEMKHAAMIPMNLVESYLVTNGITMHEFEVNPVHLRNMLNSPELSAFRIWQGRV